MPSIIEVQTALQKLINKKVTYTDMGKVWGTQRATVSARANNPKSQVTEKELKLLEDAYNVKFGNEISATDLKNRAKKIYDDMGLGDKETVQIMYRPDVHFSAGYGVEVFDEQNTQYITLDEKLFRTDKGTKIDPKKCELLTVSGNSMSPKWEDGDRFILDKSINEFIDGQTFAFKLNGECYIKEICVLGKRAKAIPLNKEYDEFYIEPEDELVIFGRVVPRIRL